MWSIHFLGAIFSALAGAELSERVRNRTTFFAAWIMLGTFSSLTLVFASFSTVLNISLILFMFGVAFGLGVPASIGNFADGTPIENRAKLGGLVLFVNGVGTFLFGTFMINDIILQAIILATWRMSGLILFLLLKMPQKDIEKHSSVSYRYIVSQRSFILYIIPWIMFSLVNYLSIPVQFKILSEEQVKLFVTIESALAGIFAILGGFLSDTFGRKRIAIIGFVMLGLSYAILGIYPENLFTWYLYTLVDGTAWGIFYVIFIMTLWGDLSYGVSTDKYYAIGGLPYFVSNFLRLTIGTYIAETILAYAIFSFTAFFLFLAVIPLMFAPETLPEKKIKERELRQYIEKAKKIKEKYT
jgi:MFS family permease